MRKSKIRQECHKPNTPKQPPFRPHPSLPPPTRAGRFGRIAIGLAACWLLALAAGAQEPPATSPSPSEQLTAQQRLLADKYVQMERLLDDMARLEAFNNPQRAALLMQALTQSKERLTAVKMNSVVELLSQEQLQRALENQREAHGDLQALLELLASEDRPDRLKREQERIREYIREVERLIRLERSVQGRTEGGGEMAELAGDQAQIADRAGELADRIREHEEGEGQAGGETAGDAGDNGNGAPGDDASDEPAGEAPSEANGEPGDGSPAGAGEEPGGAADEPGAPADDAADGSSPDAGDSGAGGPGNGAGEDPGDAGGESAPAEPTDQHPARQRIEAAEQRMREAQERLERAQREEAVEEQERARQELEAAKAELERILRQLREEELERVLALLESRFRRMLESQVRIYEETVRLDNVPDERREPRVPVAAGRLATEERKLVVEAERALQLLLEEGSSLAFPETVSQMRDDMQQVAQRLDAAQVGALTQAIEQDIIAALEEMIEALQTAQQELEDQATDPMDLPPIDPRAQPLVDALAELRMVRALQMRVNTRTQRYARLLADLEDPVGQATDPELVTALEHLSQRQERIHRITRGLVLGKNR